MAAFSLRTLKFIYAFFLIARIVYITELNESTNKIIGIVGENNAFIVSRAGKYL